LKNNEKPAKSIDSTSPKASLDFKSQYPELCNEYVNNPFADSLVISFCKGEFEISDDNRTGQLLEIVMAKNDTLFSFHFPIFNYITKKSDGAASEFMAKPCLMFILNYPNQVFKYFKTNGEDLNRFALFLGYEFYFVKSGTSSFEMSFEELKEYLTKHLDLSNSEIENTYNIFCDKTQNYINNMD
jgi:hypothetical protein